MNYYAGIGARRTPPEILELMEQLGYWLAEDDCVLRSGHAPGADQAFERGCGQAFGAAEIYLPWDSFERNVAIASSAEVVRFPSKGAFHLAEKFHPSWSQLSGGGRSLMARNCHQILGHDLQTPARFVLAWTPGAAMTGGTGQALRLAMAHDIRVFNLAVPAVESTCRGWVL